MKFIKRLFAFLISLFLIVGVAAAGLYFFLKTQYNIDLIDTYNQLKVLTQEVNEEEYLDHPFDKEKDMVDVQTIVNNSVDNMIEYVEDHYIINFDDLPSNMKTLIELSDKQIGALASTMLAQEGYDTLNIANYSFNIDLKQIEFLDIKVDGSASFNSIFKIDISSLKESMTSFPLNLFKEYVPNAIYILSTVDVIKGTEKFAYSVTANEFKINNLDDKGTDSLFETLDTLFKIGNSDDLNLLLGKTIVDALIGDSSTKGIAYSLKEYGADDFKFISKDNQGYFSITMNESVLPL